VSIEAISYVKMLDVKSSPQKLLLLMIAERIANESGKCWPSQKLIAEEASMSLTQVKVHLAALQDATWIKRTPRYAASGRRTSDEYEIIGFKEYYQGQRNFGQEVARRAQAKAKSQAADNKEKITTAGFPPHGEECDESHYSRVSDITTAGFPSLDYSRVSDHEPSYTEPKEEPSTKKTPPQKAAALDAVDHKRATKKKQANFDYGAQEASQHAEAKQEAQVSEDRDRADFDAFCRVMKDVGLEPPDNLTDGRRKGIQIIRERFGAAAFRKALENLRRSSYWHGPEKHPKGKKITITSFMNIERFVNFLEGNYNDNNVLKLPSETAVTAEEWVARMDIHTKVKKGFWAQSWGPMPGQPGCQVPDEILERFKNAA
jgi:hypothetical protein